VQRGTEIIEGPAEFGYSMERYLAKIAVSLALAAILLWGAWRAVNSFTRLLLLVTGATTLMQTYWFLSSPYEFVVYEGQLRARFLSGKWRSWPLGSLTERRGKWRLTWWAVVLLEDPEGRAAVRFWSDLPGFQDLRRRVGARTSG